MLSDEQIRHGKAAAAIDYARQLEELERRKLLSARQVGDMKAAFNDGANAMIAICRATKPAKKKAATKKSAAKVRTWAGL